MIGRRRRGHPGTLSAGFLPTDISGLQLWLRADTITGLSDGGAVTTWEDESGNNNDATQAAAGKKPTYQTNERNGLPVVRFDGTDDELEQATFSFAQPFTVFIVGAATANANCFWEGHTTVQTVSVYKSATGLLSYFAGTVVGGNAIDTNFHVISAILNGASSALYKDGTSDAAGNPGANGTTGYTVGAFADASGFLNGDIAEIIFYNSALSTANRDRVESYLGAKWGITVN